MTAVPLCVHVFPRTNISRFTIEEYFTVPSIAAAAKLTEARFTKARSLEIWSASKGDKWWKAHPSDQPCPAGWSL